MGKLDLTKQFKSYYSAKTQPTIAQIEAAQYLSIPGQGDPNDADFSANIQALYTTAYILKFAYKQKGQDFAVAKLEGLWWFDEQKYAGLSMMESVQKVPRKEWRKVWEYRLLIRLPEYVTEADVEQAIQTAIAKKQVDRAQNITLHQLNEGKVVQMLHIGPFATEIETLLVMGKFMEANQMLRNGLHHEIYLSDFRKTAPEKLKTILREPVK